MKLAREKIGDGRYQFHAVNFMNDSRTLCGYAYEGACTRHDQDFGCVEVDRGKITCETCISIIRYCKSIPDRKMRTQ